MYAIKIMSNTNMADSDVGKGFKMIMVEAGDTFEFGHDPDTGKPQVTVTGFRAGVQTLTTYPVTGNCYVLSETGKTIASFWGRSLWGDGGKPEESEEVGSHYCGVNDVTQRAIRDYVIPGSFWRNGHKHVAVTPDKDDPDPERTFG